MDAPRYAIYFVPPADTALYQLGAAFLGYDCYTGDDLGFPADCGLDAREWLGLTDVPRQYGFHATLKAPFRLAEPFAETELVAELRSFAALPRPRATIEPMIRPLERFIAVVPRAPNPTLDQLAASCVTAFDRFRRPLTAIERVKRLAAGLSERQSEYLERWGYPYVLDEFRFHLTLTGEVEVERRVSIVALLQSWLQQIGGDVTLPIACVALVRQDGPSRPFRLLFQEILNAPP